MENKLNVPSLSSSLKDLAVFVLYTVALLMSPSNFATCCVAMTWFIHQSVVSEIRELKKQIK